MISETNSKRHRRNVNESTLLPRLVQSAPIAVRDPGVGAEKIHIEDTRVILAQGAIIVVPIHTDIILVQDQAADNGVQRNAEQRTRCSM